MVFEDGKLQASSNFEFEVRSSDSRTFCDVFELLESSEHVARIKTVGASFYLDTFFQTSHVTSATYSTMLLSGTKPPLQIS